MFTITKKSVNKKMTYTQPIQKQQNFTQFIKKLISHHTQHNYKKSPQPSTKNHLSYLSTAPITTII